MNNETIRNYDIPMNQRPDILSVYLGAWFLRGIDGCYTENVSNTHSHLTFLQECYLWKTKQKKMRSIN